MYKFLFSVSLLLMSFNTVAEDYIIPQYKDLSKARLSSIECLAVNNYFEARGESDIANLFVIGVVLNRVSDKRFPDDICEVVFDNKAFSWTEDKLSDYIEDTVQYERLYNLVEYAIMHRETLKEITYGVDHYHAKRITPYWAESDKLEYITTIDNHKFYKWLKKGEMK